MLYDFSLTYAVYHAIPVCMYISGWAPVGDGGGATTTCCDANNATFQHVASPWAILGVVPHSLSVTGNVPPWCR